jgi:hydrogenase maturation protein HypF
MTQAGAGKQIKVTGIVQGVGFRPFVYQLARRHRLAGQVVNTAAGVTIHVEGGAPQIEAFLRELRRDPPPLAHIVEITSQNVSITGAVKFTIEKSKGADFRATLISPDVSVCDDCRRELFDPHDRRWGYPFINCTNCGPRYTIIDDIPYDRPKTSMRAFAMCSQCQAEYDDPNDRRFHAQPNACARCGPQVALHDHRGRALDGDDPIGQTAALLKAGHIVAIKGLGGFHLAADATNDAAVERLRLRKHREEKPLAVMSPDLETIAGYAQVSSQEALLLGSIQRPIVLLAKKRPDKLAFSVAPRNSCYGAMLPYTPLHYLLLSHGFTALVMTSGNLSEEPIAIDNDEAFERLKQIADYFLVHNRDIYLRSDDAIVRRVCGETRFIRRSRGFVPMPVFLNKAVPSLLACGAELKNTICLTKGKHAFLSQHIGDLENLATESFFRLTIDHLKRILDITPQALVCDLHPDYLSTQWALAQGLPVIQAQHHHAHVVAGMAEHQLTGPVMGLAFDGTGLGEDGTLWGGEVLMADAAGFRRVAHLAPVPMPGGAAAIKEPYRMALAYLHQTYAEQMWDLELPFLSMVDHAKADMVVEMVRKGINAPLTSSLGRLFDGVAAIIGLRQQVAFEGQAAMELEMVADPDEDQRYELVWQGQGVKQIAVAPIITGVVEDILSGLPAFIIGRKFHNTLTQGCADLCAVIGHETGLKRVVLSGGCFQNSLLLEGLTQALSQRGFSVYSHRLVPTNDGGIALGQAIIGVMAVAGVKSDVTL